MDASTGALDTEDGRALAAEVIEVLESELVRFAHRVHHDHGVELDRVRGALAVLTVLIRGGVAWTAQPDSAPGRIARAFAELLERNPNWSPALVTVIRTEVDRFTSATSGVVVADVPARTTAALLRRAGAGPELWWWASGFEADHQRCWRSCATSSARLVQVALAVGVAGDPIARALAGAFTVAATRAKTRRTAQRNDLVALLGRLVASGAAALDRDRDLVAKATALAFEMAASQQAWWTGGGAGGDRKRKEDGIAEVAVLSFQLIELFTALAAGRGVDPERYGELAGNADHALANRGLRLGALLQRELDPAFTEAIARLPR